MSEQEKTAQELGAWAAQALGEGGLAQAALAVVAQFELEPVVETGHSTGFRQRNHHDVQVALDQRCAIVAANMQAAGRSQEDIDAAMERIRGGV